MSSPKKFSNEPPTRRTTADGPEPRSFDVNGYWAVLSRDPENQTIIVEFPEHPTILTYGADREQALEMAGEALNAGLKSDYDRHVPLPRAGKKPRVKRGAEAVFVALDPEVRTAFPVRGWREENGLSQSQMARASSLTIHDASGKTSGLIPRDSLGSFENDVRFMELALRQAELAAALGETPVGAVFVFNGEAIAAAHNRREIDRDPTAHAELLALREASRRLDRWRLTGGALYVTLEPCLMCAGAIVLARLDRLVYGALDPKAGAVTSLYQTLADPRLNHRVEVVGGVLAEPCGALLSEFFRARRAR
jgi:tRNA(adenine34) deaminase